MKLYIVRVEELEVEQDTLNILERKQRDIVILPKNEFERIWTWFREELQTRLTQRFQTVKEYITKRLESAYENV